MANNRQELYTALRNADAAGDTEAAKRIASYIQTLPPIRQYDIGVNDEQIPIENHKFSPTSGNSFLQNALEGSGKMFTDMGLGARQLYAQAADAVAPRYGNLSGLVTGQGNSRVAPLQQEAADKREVDSPLMQTWGGKAGVIGTGVATALPFSALGASYAGAAGLGGGMAALTPVTKDESRAKNVAEGALLSMGGKYIGDTIGDWIRSTSNPSPGLTPAQQQAAAAGERMGMKLTPGQQTGSPGLQKFEAKLESQPWTSGPIDAIKSNNQSVLNSKWAAQIGETGNNLDATTLGSAADRLGQVFDSVRDPSRVLATNPSATTAVIDQIDNGVQGLIPGSIRDNALVKQLETVVGSGSANGEQLGALSSKLGKAAFKNMSTPAGDRDLGQALYAVKDHVDDLVQQMLSPEEAAAYSAARGQYRNLMTLTSRTNIVNPSTGNVNGVALANKLQQSDRGGFLFGNNDSDAYNAARFAQAFKPIVGNSGTATRSTKLTDLPAAIPMNLLSRLYFGPVGKIGAQAGAGMGNLLSKVPIAPQIGNGIQTISPGLGGLVPYLMQ